MQDWTAPVMAAPFPFKAADRESLETALRRAIVRFSATRIELRAAVETCATALRDQHMSPEGMLITIKAFIRTTLLADHTKLSDVDHMMDDIVHWAVLAYFATPRT